MKSFKNMLIAASIVVTAGSFAASAQAATVVNSDPIKGWQFGNGNNGLPTNTLVNTFGVGQQVYARAKTTGQATNPSDSNGVYYFALGSTPLSFDYGITAGNSPAGYQTLQSWNASTSMTFKNEGTGQFFTINPFLYGDNYQDGNGTLQNSQNLSSNYLAGVGFNANVNSLYSYTLTTNGQSVKVFAQYGTGISAAVPEPATWAMTILGFGAVGGMLRRQRKTVQPRIRFA